MKKYDLHDRNRLIKYSLIVFASIILLQAALYFALFSQTTLLSNYGWWIFYLDLSVASIAVALWYYSSYKGYQSCMASMMIGMTLGMQTGMMIGSVLGAVNGYFIGAMTGMILGTFIGIITGRESIMGMVQGAMSGVMGGTMGAMITVMMFSDNVLYFMPFYMLINVGILAGFAYMYHDEVMKDNKELKTINISAYQLTAYAIIASLLLTSILVYAPKSIFFVGG